MINAVLIFIMSLFFPIGFLIVGSAIAVRGAGYRRFFLFLWIAQAVVITLLASQ